jgi:hypothetical protein
VVSGIGRGGRVHHAVTSVPPNTTCSDPLGVDVTWGGGGPSYGMCVGKLRIV